MFTTTTHMSVDQLSTEIAVYLKKRCKKTLTPIPLSESKSILDAIETSMSKHLESTYIDDSVRNIMTLVESKLESQDIRLRWSTDNNVWDIIN